MLEQVEYDALRIEHRVAEYEPVAQQIQRHDTPLDSHNHHITHTHA